MSKYNRELKLSVAQKAINTSKRALSAQLNISTMQVKYWSTVYRIHGDKGFLHNGKPYTVEFKSDVVKTMLQNDWSITYTSAYFDLSSPGVLSEWHQRYISGGVNNLKPRYKGRIIMKKAPAPIKLKSPKVMTEKELHDELEHLRAENAVLKKLKALVQEKTSQTKKKRK